MNLIICLDDKNGYSFASRRQSKDKVQLEKMLELVGENKLYLNEYSAKLFSTLPDNIIVSKTPLQSAGADDFCFIENTELENVKAQKVVIYRWNRHYPSDKRFSDQIILGKTLVTATDFVGNSHEKITEEVYE